MVVVVRQKDPKKLLKLAVSGVVVVVMFIWYYFHMQDVYAEQERQRLAEAETQIAPKKTTKTTKTLSRSARLEQKIYKEAETIVGLIGQEYIQEIKIYSNKLLIVCDPNIPLEAVKIRYGALALTKESKKNIKIAIDLGYIVRGG